MKMFLEAYRLLAMNFDDVLDSVLTTVEDTLSYDEDAAKLKKIEKHMGMLESKRKKLTEMLLDDTISKERMMKNTMILQEKSRRLRKRSSYYYVIWIPRKILGNA